MLELIEAQEPPDAAPETRGTTRPAASGGVTCASSSEAQSALAQCRAGIDIVDRQILQLLNERTAIVQEVGRIKQEAQLPVYEPNREEKVFANVTDNNHGPLPNDAVRRIFERIIDEMRKVQRDRMQANGGTQ